MNERQGTPIIKAKKNAMDNEQKEKTTINNCYDLKNLKSYIIVQIYRNQIGLKVPS